jgi:hypothetical protein
MNNRVLAMLYDLGDKEQQLLIGGNSPLAGFQASNSVVRLDLNGEIIVSIEDPLVDGVTDDPRPEESLLPRLLAL